MSKSKTILLSVLGLVLLCGLNFFITNNFSFASEDKLGGAKQFVGKHDIKASPYFAHPDVFNMQSNEHLIVLPKFKTQQQNTGYTCGPVAANMVVEYLNGAPLHKEMEIAKMMGTSSFKGTTLQGMCKYFAKLGWKVKSNDNASTPSTYDEFTKFVTTNLQSNTPIIVENVDWGGHWRVIIGYDNMGTKHSGDDVLLMADPFDTTDHLQDGYNVISAERFFYMWFDHQLFEKGNQTRLWLTARPK